MIGLIVDGEGDHAAFSARYRGIARVLKADGPRGHTVCEAALIGSARKQIAILQAFGCSPIALVTDFESRQGTASAFCARAMQEIAKAGLGAGIHVIAADRMFENWLLADIAELARRKKYFKTVRRQRSFESTHGKDELKRLMVQGFIYNEVRHSAELFPLVRGDEASKYSASFAHFRTALGLP